MKPIKIGLKSVISRESLKISYRLFVGDKEVKLNVGIKQERPTANTRRLRLVKTASGFPLELRYVEVIRDGITPSRIIPNTWKI